MLRLERHPFGPRVYLLRRRIHEYHLGLAILVALAAGSSYALVLSSAPLSGAAETTCSVIRGPAGDSYAGGQGFYNNPGFLPYWIPLPDGAPTSSQDLPLHLLVH